MNDMRVDDLPPSLRAVLADLDCIAESDDQGDAWIDAGVFLHIEEYVYADLEIETAESLAWVQAAIAAQPGVWTARLCRQMHDLPETKTSVLHCGLCQQFANCRKRRRAARLPPWTLPGFEEIGGGYQLRPPCSRRGLTWLRKRLYRLRDRGRIETRRERIPDGCQARGWDWGTRIYPL